MKSQNQFRRRAFLKALSFTAPLVAGAPALLAQAQKTSPSPRGEMKSRARELAADLVIIGGGLGGCAAALAAARNGLRVILTEETDWIGGQLTSQAVPPDENPWIETFGGTRSYLELRTRIRDYYRRNFPLTDAARAKLNLNPGNGGVSKLCHEPRVAVAVLSEMLAAFVASGKVRVLLRHKAMSASVTADKVEAVQVRSAESGHDLVLRAPMFVDATEMGDLLPLTKTEYVTGAEAQSETGEPHAAHTAQPQNMQAFTVCFPTEYIHGEDHIIEPPREWKFWRDYVPKLTPPWTGRLLDLTYCHPQTLEPRNLGFDPVKRAGLFHYRQIVDKNHFAPGTFAGDTTLVNWPQNDYLLGNPFECAPEKAAKHIERAKQLSLSLLYWLQTAAPRPDGGTGWKGLRLRPDITGTEDGLAKYPYIRESRRIKAEFTVLEQHVGTDARAQALGKAKDDVKAENFPDTVGIGSYRIDLHPSTGGDNYIDISSLPFQIPLGALLPRRMENLLPACKNLGATHITNGCYRLHPVEWNIGESAGALAAFCAAKKKMPREVRKQSGLLKGFQDSLAGQGVPLAWPAGATAR
ncbi:MAG: FAD-dependent oxidoreductase [Pedosphaera sp.]|nr:FAD-dependent oxidoreductase [Pedosphaera sp.]